MRFKPGQVWMWHDDFICLLLKRTPEKASVYYTMMDDGEEHWTVLNLCDGRISAAAMHNRRFRDGQRWVRLP